MRTALLALVSALLIASSPTLAEAPDPAEPLPVDTIGALGLGDVVARVDKGTTSYLALAKGGVAVVDTSDAAGAKLVTTLLPGQAVSRLLVDGDQLWAIVLTESATAFSIAIPGAPLAMLPHAPASTSAPAVATAPPTTTTPTVVATAPTRATTTRAKVLDVAEGRVIFDAGTAQGFASGMRVKVIAQRLVRKPDLKKGGTIEVPSNEVTAVVTIEDIEEDRAMALLGRGDVAMPGDVVEVTDAPLSENIMLPRRAPFTWRAGFMVRPFLGVGSPGVYPVGALIDGYVHYTFADLPLSLSAEIAPLGFAFLSNDTHYPGTFVGGASYVTDYFEIGLGAGALIGNKGPCFTAFTDEQVDIDGDGIIDEFRQVPDGEPTCEENNGATFNQMLRLGSLDGLHLTWASSIFARPDGFALGVGRGEIAVPVSSRLGLFGAGGVGENGWAFGEVGVRSLFGGTGAPGTVILSASLGGSAVFDGPGQPVDGFFQRETVGGPAVGFGIEWRM